MTERKKALARWYQQRRDLVETMAETATRIFANPSEMPFSIEEVTADHVLGNRLKNYERWCAITNDVVTFTQWAEANKNLTAALNMLPEQPDERPRSLWGPVICHEPQRIIITRHEARSSKAVTSMNEVTLSRRLGRWDTAETLQPSSFPHLLTFTDKYARLYLPDLLQALGREKAQLHQETGSRFVARILDREGNEIRQRWQVVGVLSKEMQVEVTIGGGSEVQRRDRRTNPLWTWDRWTLYDIIG